MLLATTHEDLTDDLRPDLHVRCHGEGRLATIRHDKARAEKPISFTNDLHLEEGTRNDWDDFARWHYRSHLLAFVRRVVLLKHAAQPIGICVFTAPAASLSLRSQYFGLTAPRSRSALLALNQQLWLLARVVLHPTYRGAGIAADFVRRACRSCPVDWIETLSAMGHANPFFERAGFVRVGVFDALKAGPYGGQFSAKQSCTQETARKSHHSSAVYYVFDNRQ